jgi:protease-4
MRALFPAIGLVSSLTLSGCIIIPVGDLLRGPALREQTLLEGEGFFSKEKIAIIDVDGMISGTESANLLFPQENVVAETKARLDMARADPEVKAVVLRISSPGGEATSCDIVHHEVKRFKKDSGLPVVACIVDQGTSGAYYVAVAADTIVAHPTAIVGSIGVILNSFDLSGLLSKIGVSTAPVKSAEKKDLNSPFRPMTAEERNILQKLVDDMYQRFVQVVDDGRPDLKKEDVLALADGRVVSGSEAASLKLVDKTGYLSDALEEARSKAGIESPTVVIYTRAAKSGANIYTDALVPRPAARGVQLSLSAEWAQGPKLYYLWQPGF